MSVGGRFGPYVSSIVLAFRLVVRTLDVVVKCIWTPQPFWHGFAAVVLLVGAFATQTSRELFTRVSYNLHEPGAGGS